jgi:hypothetical protein
MGIFMIAGVMSFMAFLSGHCCGGDLDFSVLRRAWTSRRMACGNTLANSEGNFTLKAVDWNSSLFRYDTMKERQLGLPRNNAILYPKLTSNI